MTSRIHQLQRAESEALATRGAYRLSPNPIDLADRVAFVGFALLLPPIGLLLAVLLYAHYAQIMRHEEGVHRTRRLLHSTP